MAQTGKQNQIPQSVNEAVARARAQVFGEEEMSTVFLNVEERVVTSNNDSSLDVNTTNYGAKTLDLEPGDEVKVATLPNCLLVVPKDQIEDDGGGGGGDA